MGGDEDCVEISPRGQLNDESCSESFGFICEKSSSKCLYLVVSFIFCGWILTATVGILKLKLLLGLRYKL